MGAVADYQYNQKAGGKSDFLELFVGHMVSFIDVHFDKGNAALFLIVVKGLLNIRVVVNHIQLLGHPWQQGTLEQQREEDDAENQIE